MLLHLSTSAIECFKHKSTEIWVRKNDLINDMLKLGSKPFHVNSIISDMKDLNYVDEQIAPWDNRLRILFPHPAVISDFIVWTVDVWYRSGNDTGLREATSNMASFFDKTTIGY